MLDADLKEKRLDSTIQVFAIQDIDCFGIVAGGKLRDLHIELSMIYQSAALLLVVCIALLLMMLKRVKWENNANANDL